MGFEFKGALRWGNPHPIAAGAWEIDYILNEGFALTPLHENAAAMLNQMPVEGIAPFGVGSKQDILQKPFPLFNLVAGQIVADYDLIYVSHGMLFMGAKHVDGPLLTNQNIARTSCRFLETKRLLAHSPASISAISQQLAFQAPSQFGRWFKNAAGVSPGDFRLGFADIQ